MALRSTLFFVVAAAIGSWFVVWPFVPDPRTTAAYYRMEIGLRAEQPGHAQLFWDLGFDYRENESSRADYEAGRDVVLNFPLPAKSIRALRFDPNTGPVRMTILHARILTRYGEVLREIRPSQFKPSFDIAAAEEQG
ncbi:MAG TPA: hypothetical protein VHF69_04250, partial [Candidatus Synoicihabitans sp.]|nr:hypothetical protein [Candidatus Synoicihabitans sp.]